MGCDGFSWGFVLFGPSLRCSGLTRCSEKSILEISQGNTDFAWPLENLFQGQKPRRFENFQNGYKWRNEADRRHCLIFIFHPGPPKRRKKPEVWKNRLWAQSGSGYWGIESAYQNPRKGTETPQLVFRFYVVYPRQRPKIPVRGLKQIYVSYKCFAFARVSVPKSPLGDWNW